MTPKRRYERLAFWMENIYGEWITLPWKDVAPSDVRQAQNGRTSWPRSIIGVGVRRRR